MSNPKLTDQFMELAIQHDPPEAAIAGLHVTVSAVCIMSETVTEAVDMYRALTSVAEFSIRERFPKIADIKTEERARHAARARLAAQRGPR